MGMRLWSIIACYASTGWILVEVSDQASGLVVCVKGFCCG